MLDIDPRDAPIVSDEESSDTIHWHYVYLREHSSRTCGCADTFTIGVRLWKNVQPFEEMEVCLRCWRHMRFANPLRRHSDRTIG